MRRVDAARTFWINNELTAPPAWKKQTPAGRPAQQGVVVALEPVSKMAADIIDGREALGGNLRLIRSTRRRVRLPALTRWIE